MEAICSCKRYFKKIHHFCEINTKKLDSKIFNVGSKKNVCKLADLGQIVKKAFNQKNNKDKIKIRWSTAIQILDLIMCVLTKLKKLVLNQSLVLNLVLMKF